MDFMDLNLSGYNSGGVTPGGGSGMDFLSSLVSAGVNLFTSDKASKQASNQWLSNFALQDEAMRKGISIKTADARNAEKKYGINALTLLGAGGVPSPSPVIGDPGAGSEAMSKMGQDLGRAVAAATTQESRMDQLKERLIETQIKGMEADFVGKSINNARAARTLGQPGTPPGRPYNWMAGGPGDPRGPGKGRPNMFTEYWDNVQGRVGGQFLSAELSQAMQSAAALGISPATTVQLPRD